MKKKIAILLTSVLLGTSLCTMGAFAENKTYDVDKTYEITGYDQKTSSGGVFVYPNDTNKTRVIGSSEYNFRYSKILIFNKFPPQFLVFIPLFTSAYNLIATLANTSYNDTP